ncbi:proteoglycan 4 [Schistocerca gregaria]|uniref:proteoglycan 4 n=1 Tax=Schistocerca gregaria TaxID=7010 RepID=UPI00211DDD93|nr:proteoglycan 4 [Schistocerca gregaria]
MRTHRHRLASVAMVAMLAALVGFPYATARPEGGGAEQPEVATADPADNDVDGAGLGVDVEETVAEVQRRLKENPHLPRLTPDEIKGLIREITANETGQPEQPADDAIATTATAATTTTTTASSNSDTNSSDRGDRSLVLVMSHSAANMSGERLQSLFTQPPVTRVVPDELLHQSPGAQHQYQPPAPPRPAQDIQRVTAGPVRSRPATTVPPNHRPSYDEPEHVQGLEWKEQLPAKQTERPLLFNFFEDDDFTGSTRPPLVPTTEPQTSTTNNILLDQRTTQYPETTEDATTQNHAAEYTTEDIQRPIINKPPSKPNRLSGYKNQQRHSPLRGSMRRKKPVQSSTSQYSFGVTTDQTSIDQTPSENHFRYRETSTLTPTTTDTWNEDAKRQINITEDVTSQTVRPAVPENFEITVGSYNTKPRITFQKGNLNAESPAADIIYSEDWRPPLAIKPHSEEPITEELSGHIRQSQTTTSRASSNTQRPFQAVEAQPFYTRKKPSYITSESILTTGGQLEGNLPFITNNGPISHHGGGDARPPGRHPYTPQGSGPSSALALVDSGSRPVLLEVSTHPTQHGHSQTDGPVDSRVASTPSSGLVQRRPGTSSGKRRRPIHRKRPVPHDSANVVATVEASYIRDSAAQGDSVKPFRPLDPGVLDSLVPRAPLSGGAHPQPTTTTAAPTIASTVTPDLSAAADALSPAVRELLQSLGLLDPPPQPPPTAAHPPMGPPPPDPAPYRAFKPLPQSRSEPEEQDMRHLLHRFGLLDPAPPTHGRRRQKTLAQPPQSAGNERTGDGSASGGSTTTSSTPLTLEAIDTSMLTDEMRAVLHNLGIVPGTGRVDERPTTQPPVASHTTVWEPTTDGGNGTDDSTVRQGPEHVFSPTSLKHSEEETARLQAVLDSVRQFAATHLNVTYPANGSGTTEAIRDSRGLQPTTSASPLAAGPDPLSFDELLAEINSEESRKNEVKRQQPTDTDTNSTAPTGAPAKETEEVTNRANRTAEDEARVQALSESFGGDIGGGDIGDSDYDEKEGGGEQAVQRPNGLYFLFDWNSFLRVGEEDNPRVNLRFSPRAGNPRNFLPITVP